MRKAILGLFFATLLPLSACGLPMEDNDQAGLEQTVDTEAWQVVDDLLSYLPAQNEVTTEEWSVVEDLLSFLEDQNATATEEWQIDPQALRDFIESHPASWQIIQRMSYEAAHSGQN